jgi:hypothetical protein
MAEMLCDLIDTKRPDAARRFEVIAEAGEEPARRRAPHAACRLKAAASCVAPPNLAIRHPCGFVDEYAHASAGDYRFLFSRLVNAWGVWWRSYSSGTAGAILCC